MLNKVIQINDKKITYNCSALVTLKFASEFNKNSFDIFEKLQKTVKMSEEEQKEFLLKNQPLIDDIISLSYCAIKTANSKEFPTLESYAQKFGYNELIAIANRIVSDLYRSQTPVFNQRVKSKKKKHLKGS